MILNIGVDRINNLYLLYIINLPKKEPPGLASVWTYLSLNSTNLISAVLIQTLVWLRCIPTRKGEARRPLDKIYFHFIISLLYFGMNATRYKPNSEE